MPEVQNPGRSSRGSRRHGAMVVICGDGGRVAEQKNQAGIAWRVRLQSWVECNSGYCNLPTVSFRCQVKLREDEAVVLQMQSVIWWTIVYVTKLLYFPVYYTSFNVLLYVHVYTTVLKQSAKPAKIPASLWLRLRHSCSVPHFLKAIRTSFRLSRTKTFDIMKEKNTVKLVVLVII